MVTCDSTPVFVVGAPRSGTTLLAAMLSAHGRLHCGVETHFFSKLTGDRLAQALNDHDWPKCAVSALTSLTINGQSVCQAYGVSGEELDGALREMIPSVPAMLEALTCPLMRASGKSRVIEKTPNHLLHLLEIRTHYPKAPIIRIIRDPRDSALSMRKLPWTSSRTLANAYLVAEWHGRSKSFFDGDACTFTLRYEDLVTNPESQLRAICKFLSEDYEPRMLDTSQSGAAIAASGEAWKAQVSRPLDVSRVAVWKREMPDEVKLAAELICGEFLERYGYEYSHKPAATFYALPLTREVVEANEQHLLDAAASGIRFLPCGPKGDTPIDEGANTPLVFTKIPSLGRTRPARIVNLVRHVARLTARRLTGKPVYWLRDNMALQNPKGISERVARVATSLLGRSATWESIEREL